MNLIRTAVETLLTLLQQEIHANTLLVPAGDPFEIKDTPNLTLQGPLLKENRRRRNRGHCLRRDLTNLTYQKRHAPRLYHLDFEITLTHTSTPQLLDLQERLSAFFQDHPLLQLGEHGRLNLNETTPLGGLKRVNLSNLKQSSGRLRIEDCPVYGDKVENGRLIRDRIVIFDGDVNGERRWQPPSQTKERS